MQILKTYSQASQGPYFSECYRCKTVFSYTDREIQETDHSEPCISGWRIYATRYTINCPCCNAIEVLTEILE